MISSDKYLNTNLIEMSFFQKAKILHFLTLGFDRLTELLIRRGADVNIVGSHGDTAVNTLIQIYQISIFFSCSQCLVGHTSCICILTFGFLFLADVGGKSR